MFLKHFLFDHKPIKGQKPKDRNKKKNSFHHTILHELTIDHIYAACEVKKRQMDKVKRMKLHLKTNTF